MSGVTRSTTGTPVVLATTQNSLSSPVALEPLSDTLSAEVHFIYDRPVPPFLTAAVDVDENQRKRRRLISRRRETMMITKRLYWPSANVDERRKRTINC